MLPNGFVDGGKETDKQVASGPCIYKMKQRTKYRHKQNTDEHIGLKIFHNYHQLIFMKKRGKVFCFFVVIRKFFVQQLLDNAVYVCYPLENQVYICGEEQTMQIISMDLFKRGGKIKPMNAVNNGPTPKPVRTTDSNFDAYAALEIP